MTGIALVGCGFVADYYVQTILNHPELELIGGYDRDIDRLETWSNYHDVKRYDSLDELLGDDRVDVVVNLTNPESHYAVSRQALEAGKHVYSEKPLALRLDHASELVRLADALGLQISSAPCNLMSETAQTFWKALQDEIVGKAYLVYAELDDDLIHRAPYQAWKSESGAPWPAKNEFEVGCTMEHAGYYLGWLVAFFGSIDSITTFGSVCVEDKDTDFLIEKRSPDFSCACVQFDSGMVARLTCSIVGSHDHRLRVFADGGVLSTEDCWFFRSPVTVQRRWNIRRRMMMSPFKKKLALIGDPSPKFAYKGAQQMDFCAGVADLADAVSAGRPCYLNADFCLHVNEAVIAISESLTRPGCYDMTTTCGPMQPLAEFRKQHVPGGLALETRS